MKIYAALPGGTAEHDVLRRFAGADELWLADPAALTEADRRAFGEAEVAFGLFPAELLPAAVRLRWIQFISVGIEGYLAVDWGRFGSLVCTNLRGVYADPMAQTVLAGILALNRGIDRLVELRLRREWQKAQLHSGIDLLQGAQVLLLGAGSVNRRLRALLQPFRCTFTVFARTEGDIRSADELDAALANADLVCAALPDTPATRGLLDARRLARMKPSALFANVGRGSLVDEPALVAALHAGRLRGAVLDVTQREPLPADDPLWACPRTILTQHTAAGSRQVMAGAVAFFGANLERYRTGHPLENVIDWSRGY